MKKIVFEIHPLTCVGCAKKIEDRFYEQSGILAINVYGQLGKILVRYDGSEINIEQLETILAELDYPIISKTTA
ncbi:cation transporter [Salicibibacter halophilus]|uniref:Cation transporter n=1 Tax=Salicibibacter halophilus TaxID=2502791 RepID=A0A514LK12_9BACI|nr:heavy-metal-associated domain-containing protein [Salicibibacter halophilus]QDI92153.1 cation transporter [Salicibibacter halophilus]